MPIYLIPKRRLRPARHLACIVDAVAATEGRNSIFEADREPKSIIWPLL